MKYLPNIAGVLLGLVFLASSVPMLLKIGPTPPAPIEGTPAAAFMAAFMPTGYMTFVKVLEALGGLLVVIPKTRNLGLLILGPILVNIFAYLTFVMKGEGLFSPVMGVIAALALYLLWAGRKEFAGLIPGKTPTPTP